jgi:4'-phosphopantetheinyl transferase EntD
VDNFSEDEQLALAVLGIWRSMGIDVEAAVDKRAEIEAELASRRKLKGLSAEKVRELLRRAGDAVDQEASRDAVNL